MIVVGFPIVPALAGANKDVVLSDAINGRWKLAELQEEGEAPNAIAYQDCKTLDEAQIALARLGDGLDHFIIDRGSVETGPRIIELISNQDAIDLQKSSTQSILDLIGGQGGGEAVEGGPDAAGDDGKVPPAKSSSDSDVQILRTLLSAIGTPKRAEAARNHLIAMEMADLAASHWKLGTDGKLLAALGSAPDDDVRKISIDVLRSRNGLMTKAALEKENGREAIKLLQQMHLTNFIGKQVELFGEVINQRKQWTGLAKFAPVLLVLSLVASVAGSVAAFILTGDGHLNGYQLPLILFVLALVAISPSALLLLERPLKGLDSWSPGGKVEEDANEADSKTPEEPAASESKVESSKEVETVSRLEIKIVSD